nr:transcriptional regulator [Streptomyces sp. SID12501]
MRIASFLSGCEEAEFRAVQEYCELTAPTLSKHAAALEATGYVEIRKGHVGKTPRTWLTLTEQGRSALAGHLAELQCIAATAARHGNSHRA